MEMEKLFITLFIGILLFVVGLSLYITTLNELDAKYGIKYEGMKYVGTATDEQLAAHDEEKRKSAKYIAGVVMFVVGIPLMIISIALILNKKFPIK